VCALSLLTGLQVLSWSRIAPLPRTLVYTSWCCLVLAWEISVCVQFLAWKEPAQVCFFGEKHAASFGKTRRKFSAASARYAPLSFLVFNAGSRGIQVRSTHISAARRCFERKIHCLECFGAGLCMSCMNWVLEIS
jgi:hypothetical protein